MGTWCGIGFRAQGDGNKWLERIKNLYKLIGVSILTELYISVPNFYEREISYLDAKNSWEFKSYPVSSRAI